VTEFQKLRGGKGGAEGGRRRARMNVANIHALRRAVRRLKGFENVVQRVVHSLARLKHLPGMPHHHKAPRRAHKR
jgi:hypothetical protein